ncbi:Crp/Fnr family transcriptional regulator [Galbibacter sp. PAP.153]|uniref:Crp/Fnr family transcriptional regulator n=1 Tax=Galbibacter sp. PAP.153 TaxID=3104623 RepID=UPI0030094F7A
MNPSEENITHRFFKHLNTFVTVEEKDFPHILSYFNTVKLSKKEIAMRAGGKCNTKYFVLSGCLHMFFTDEKGADRTIQFALENWWLTDALALHHQTNTDFNIQAVEDSEVLEIDTANHDLLLEAYPQMEKYFRIMYQIAYGASVKRMYYIFNYSKEEIFFSFREQFPEFVQRVPQYLIATYLGLTPEYLSKLRAKKVS